MTAETDLLPLPDWMECLGEVNAADIRDYARANVAHATAPLQAEIEALRAEVERANSWNASVSVCRDHVAGIVDGPCVICALDAAEARADQLEDALREAYGQVRELCDCYDHPYPEASFVRYEDLLREQEEGHE